METATVVLHGITLPSPVNPQTAVVLNPKMAFLNTEEVQSVVGGSVQAASEQEKLLGGGIRCAIET